jgi:NADH-quinone oxidoreductase subunit L
MNPGALYVTATLLPLLSFLVLFIGGRRWGKYGAYVAIAAIGGACILSVTGFIWFVIDSNQHHTPGHHAHAWHGSITWAKLSGFGADEGATELKLGYYIDHLSATMFVMVTFIASLIHIFATGYMAEERQEQVEDHQAHVTRKGRYSRFFMYFSLFSFSMLNLVLADNLFQVFVSWELVGICSYFLIGFYYERRSAANAANKAFIMNRVGDAGFIIGILILWTHLGTLGFHSEHKTAKDEFDETVYVYSEVSVFDALRSPHHAAHHRKMEVTDPKNPDQKISLGGQFMRVDPVKDKNDRDRLLVNDEGRQIVVWDQKARNSHYHAPSREGYMKPASGEGGHDDGLRTMPYWMLVLAGIGVFLGCVGKSAQFPLQAWLPDAMEGPTPVSALVHSATMVAAGVYLVGRVFPLFAPEVLLTIAYTGGITLFIAATIAIVQTDIKKVLAYSTVSQLGFMMLALGVGGWVAGLFHLLTHAFFKALLFLCSGSVIHGCHHEQDMSKMGGLYPKMKTTALTMLVGCLAIAGTPLFSGWYSKDAILVSSLSFVSLNPQHMLLFILPLLTAGITAFYMFRMWFMTFTGEPRDHHVYEHAHESPRSMTVPLMILALCSIVVAWGANPWNVQGSALEHFLHHAQPESVTADRSLNLNLSAHQMDTAVNRFQSPSWLEPFSFRSGMGPHDVAGYLALLFAGLGVVLAFAVYYFRALDPADTKESFPRVHALFANLWYFDKLYSVFFVRPALVVGQWCAAFDRMFIDGFVHRLARSTVRWSNWNGTFDLGVVDGLVNLTATVVFGVGNWLRGVQTGYIRNYVLFMALAAVGIFAVLSYLVAMAG